MGSAMSAISTAARAQSFSTDVPVPIKSFSVVIPALNEEVNIRRTIKRAQHHGLTCSAEVIVVDGMSVDGTSEAAKKSGAKVIRCARGRGKQLNAGWKIATGDWVVFLHADTLLPPGYGRPMQMQMSKQTSCKWGCFEGISTEISGWSMRVVEWGVRARTRHLHLPYGDQAIFIHQDALRSLNGFEEIPLLEDVTMVRKLRHTSPPVIVPELVQTSGRRWKELGVWRTMLVNQLIVAGYVLGVNPDRLAKVYETTGIQRQKKV